MERKRTIQLVLLGLLWVSLLLSFPGRDAREANIWEGIELPSALVESRLHECDRSDTHRKACAEVTRFLQEQRGKIPESELVAGALNLWLAAFDPHAQISPAKKAENAMRFEKILVRGIGAKLRFHKEKTVVAYTMEGSGAEESGLRAGDEIIAVNGVNLTGLSRSEREFLLKRAKAPFHLEVLRQGKSLALFAREKRVTLPNVEWHIRNRENFLEGIIRIRSFAKDSTCEEIRSALESLSARKVARIELDLRDNPGGLVREAQCAAGLFLGAGRLFARMESTGAQDLIPATPAGFSRADDKEFVLFTDQDQASDHPLVVRINHNTASAAEMFTAALQDSNRAQVIGARSFGKGSMQSVFHPWDDERLYFTRTTHRIVRPSGENLDLAGVSPDIVTEDAEGANFPREADLTQ